MNTAEHFDPQRALDYAARLAVPRRPGSAAERRAGEQIAGLLEGWGYRVEQQAFSFLDALPAFLKAEVLIGQGLILGVLWLTWIGSPPASAGAIALAIALAAWVLSVGPMNDMVLERSLDPHPAGRGSRSERLMRLLARPLQSANYVAFLDRAQAEEASPGNPEEDADGATTWGIELGLDRRAPGQPVGPGSDQRPAGELRKPALLLVAHYDSKSQRLPIAARIVLVSLAMGGALLLSGLVLLSLASPAGASLIFPVGLLAGGAGIPLLFLGEGNRSPGAIDNASGAGLVLHMAEVYARSPAMQESFTLACIFTGAEEAGCVGARAFVRQHAKLLEQLTEQRALGILNIDGIGVDGSLRWIGRRSSASGEGTISLFERLARSAQTRQVALRGFGLPGALYDHMPFAWAGFETGSIIATGRASLAVHTAQDDVQRLSVNGFRKAGELVLGMMASPQGPLP